MLHNDIPTQAQVQQLAQAEGGWRVSIYVEAGVLAQQGELARIALKDQTRNALEQLETAGASNRDITAIREHLDEIIEDAVFWNFQSRSLAVFATVSQALTFRLPNVISPVLSVGNRFYVKPLLRTLSFPQAAFVLSLSANDVHLLSITPDDEPRKVESEEIPRDFDHAVHRHFHAGQSTPGRMQGEEGEKTRLRQFARIVDRGVRAAIGQSTVPLFLAAAEPLESMFRTVSTLPNLQPKGISGNTEAHSDQELATMARALLDDVYADEVAHLAELLAERANSGRAATDISDIARAAAFGAIHTLIINMDAAIPGSVDESTGEVTFDSGSTQADSLGVLEDIVRLALASDSRIIAVREGEVPGAGEAAAILRYAV